MRFQVAAFALVAGLVAAAPVAQDQNIDAILTELAKNNPGDAEVARDAFKVRRRAGDDVESILKELEKNSYVYLAGFL